MSLFSFGSDSAQSQATSQGGSVGFGQSFGQSLGFSGGSSLGQNFGQSFVDQSQQPFLDFLRNTAQSQFTGNAQDASGLQQQFGGLSDFAQNNPHATLLANQGAGNDELVGAQTRQLSQDLSTQFLEQLQPGIRRQAGLAGQQGGGRQGVAEGLAIQGQQRALASGAVGFQTADAQRALQANIAGGQQFQQGLGQAGQFLQAGQQAGFNPLNQLAQLFGGPTVLNQQGGFDTSQQFGFDTSQQGAFDFNQAFNQSQQSSRASGGNFSIL